MEKLKCLSLFCSNTVRTQFEQRHFESTNGRHGNRSLRNNTRRVKRIKRMRERERERERKGGRAEQKTKIHGRSGFAKTRFCRRPVVISCVGINRLAKSTFPLNSSPLRGSVSWRKAGLVDYGR